MKDVKESVSAVGAQVASGVASTERPASVGSPSLPVSSESDRKPRTAVRRILIASASAAASAGVGFAAFWFLGCDGDASSEPATVRVQSRSMEPLFSGPGFVSVCPSCAGTFVTSIDVQSVPTTVASARDGETPPGNENSPEAQAFRERARCVTCPSCGTEVPASAAAFRDGDAAAIERVDDPSSARYQPFVFRAKDGSMTLKRLIGLPGERIEIRNGDVLINGAADWRTPLEIWSTASEIQPVRELRLPDRVYLRHVTPTRLTPPFDKGETTLFHETGISNESPIPCFNGGNASAPEPVRDFLLTYNWTRPESDALPGESVILTLVQRPRHFYLLRYDISRHVGSARRLDVDPKRGWADEDFTSLSAKEFDELPDLPTEVLTEAPADSDPSPRTVAVGVVAADGWITLEIDGTDVFRVSTGEESEEEERAIATPFIALSPREQTSGMRIFRDVHYGAPPEGRGERTLGEGEYYMLGDNSPASVDSRFPSFGTADLKESYLARQRRWQDGRPEAPPRREAK